MEESADFHDPRSQEVKRHRKSIWRATIGSQYKKTARKVEPVRDKRKQKTGSDLLYTAARLLHLERWCELLEISKILYFQQAG